MFGREIIFVSELDGQKYRERAAQCVALAERAQRDDDKATWLELAGKWQRLADEMVSRGQQAEQPQATKSPAGRHLRG